MCELRAVALVGHHFSRYGSLHLRCWSFNVNLASCNHTKSVVPYDCTPEQYP
jgi:hypothetical protein